MSQGTLTVTSKVVVRGASKVTPKARKEEREAKAETREPQKLQMENLFASGSTTLESTATRRSAATLIVVASASAKLIPPSSAQESPRVQTLVKVNLLD
jgi:hypothetical protein